MNEDELLEDYLDEDGLDLATRNFKAYIDRKIDEAPNVTIINGYLVESIDNGDDTQTLQITNGDAAVTTLNLALYKFQDLTHKLYIDKFAELATNQEYIEAEIYLQNIYKEVMEGNNE